jgi:hypothetical protein
MEAQNMLKPKSHLTLAVVLVAATMLVAGSVAIASNTGFKINKALTIAGTGQIGNNWTSIPYFNPYGNVGALCTQIGLISAGITRAQVTLVTPATGAGTTVQCGTAAANSLAIIPGLGLRIRNAGTGAPTSAIIVGSHNPSLSLTVPKSGAGSIGNFWFAVPYHTTAVTAADLCLQSGFTSSGINRAQIVRLNAATGGATTASCGTAAATSLTLVLGEAVRVREPNGPLTFIPSHF